MIETESGVQVLGHGAVLSFEQFPDELDSWWIEVRSTNSGEVDSVVRIPASELGPLAQWMLDRVKAGPVPGIELPPVQAMPTQYCGRGICAREHGHDGRCSA